MVLAYMIVICFSAALGAWAGTRLLRRIAPMLRLQLSAGWCAAVPAIAFLIVVAAPASVLVAALFIGLMTQLMPQRMARPLPRLMLMVATVLIALVSLPMPVASYLTVLPYPAVLAAAGLVWLAVLFSAGFTPDRADPFAFGTILALAAAAASPLLAPGSSSVTLDAAIIGSALVGLLAARGMALPMGLPPRFAFGVVVGYLQLSALWHGAWLPAAASLLLWLGAAGWNGMAPATREVRHA